MLSNITSELLDNALSERDQALIETKGLEVSGIRFQLEHLIQQRAHVELERPATLGDGIGALPSLEHFKRFSNAANQGRISEFIPASGDATRMFDSLLRVYRNGHVSEAALVQASRAGDRHATDALVTLRNIQNFAIWIDLERMECSPHNWHGILDAMLSTAHLALSRKPKGLIPFHRYGSTTRTAIEEHCLSALNLGFNRLHFTIKEDFAQQMDRLIKVLEEVTSVRFNNDVYINYSFQKRKTDTIALAEDGKIYRDGCGSIVFRPGGHGSLLENLMEASGDIVFLSNVDNIVIENKSLQRNKIMKVLCERLLELEERIHHALRKLDSHGDITDAANVMKYDLDLPVPSGSSSADYFFEQLNRPIRVCGVIKNQGDVGGGPFWTRAEGAISRVQIIESAELANSSKEQLEIAKRAAYFNPVNIVCSIRDFRGMPFNLFNFRDENAVILTKKSSNGNLIFAYEHPGLWNGGMAQWNSVFIEVPVNIFQGVKQFNDLLSPFHRYEV